MGQCWWGARCISSERNSRPGSGSVDEKLQTCHFKKRQYEKLVAPLGLRVAFYYLLNDWFRNASYRDVLEYIEEVGCRYFFKEIPLVASDQLRGRCQRIVAD